MAQLEMAAVGDADTHTRARTHTHCSDGHQLFVVCCFLLLFCRKSSRARKRKKKKVDVDAEIEAMVDGLTEAELHELLAEYEAQASFDSMAALLAEAARGDGENETGTYLVG